MSYILEALKKAQAERQLGDAPTIHAPQPVHVAAPRAATGRRPLLLGLGAIVVVGAGALLYWRQADAPVKLVAPSARAPAAVVPVPVPAAPAPAPASVPTPAARTPERPANELEVSAPPPPVRKAPRPAETAPPAQARAAAKPVAAPPAPAAPAPEDSLPFLQQLPESVRGQVPRVTFGGYMYSANPADRLLLVDKTLRHEGEEVAPGLVLEKLLPRAAVMNYRGTRYRVAY
jgi:general secretion pathway protein B